MISRTDVLTVVGEIYTDGPFVTKHLQRLRPYICPFELLVEAVPSGSRVLDVGCGAGLFLGLLAKLDRLCEGYGFDIDHRAIACANQMKRQLPEHVTVVFENRTSHSPWPEGKFDVVSMIDVIHHIERSQQADVFTKVAASITPGGFFLYKDMVERPRWRALANRVHDLVLAQQWIHYLPAQKARLLAEEAGMSMIDSQSANRLWYGHEFLLFQRDKD